MGLSLNGQTCTGNATLVGTPSTGVTNADNALGDPDGAFAEIFDTGDTLFLELQDFLDVGAAYTITWRRKSTYTNTAVADLVVAESQSINGPYTINSTIMTDDRVNFVDTDLTSLGTTKFLKAWTATGSNDDVDFDAVTYSNTGCTFPWDPRVCNSDSILLHKGISVLTCGVVENQESDERYTIAFISANDAETTTGRAETTNPDSVYHNDLWTVDQVGNLFGVAINEYTSQALVTASSNYGSEYFGQVGVLGYGSIGAGAAIIN